MDATAAAATRPPGAPEGSQVARALYEVLRATPDSRVAVAHRLGLNLSEVDAMEHLMGGPIGPVELSRRLHMTSASATALVHRLESAGHVVREPDPTDGRRLLVRPTPQGARAVYAQIGPIIADLVAAEDGMTSGERDVVLAYLRRVVEVLERHGENQTPG